MVAISRRILLQLATVASTAAFLTPNATAAFGASAPAELPSVETSPGAINAYMAKAHFSGFANLTEIKEEYANAAATFPLVLAEGWVFPSDPGLSDPKPDALWRRGSGVTAAYMIWQKAIASEAYEGQKRGDAAQKDRYLDILEAAYATDVRKAAIIDDDNVFLQGAKQSRSAAATAGPLESARAGDFTSMCVLMNLT